MEFRNNFLVQKYFLQEFFLPFLFSLGIFLGITLSGFVMFNLIDLMVKYGVAFSLIIKLFLYSVPEMVFYSIPMSILLAGLTSSTRLSRDNEIIIFQMTGKSLPELFFPVFLLVVVLSIFSFFFNELIVSKSNEEVTKGTIYAQMKNNLPLSKKNIFYKEFEKETLKRAFYAGELSGKLMQKVVTEEFQNGEIVSIIQAEKALFNGDTIDFKNGTIFVVSDLYSMRFKDYSIPFISTLESIANEVRTPKEMNFKELKKHIDNLKHSGNNTAGLEVQLHQKLSLPFTSFLFLLVAIPAGLIRKSKSSSFGFAFSLLFIFVYYSIMFIFTALGSLEYINPLISAWIPNIFVFISGIILWNKITY